jgi:hypothetical protein
MKSQVGAVMSGLVFIVSCGIFAADIPVNFSVENRGASCKKITPALKSNTKLPDPFAWQDGSGRIKSTADWICRRNEIKADLEAYEIGPKPDKPELTATYTGGNLAVTVTVAGKTLTITSKVTVPSGTGPFPVVIGMGSGAGSVGSFTGCIQVTYNYGKIYTLDYNGKRNQSDGFFTVYPDLWMKVGGYSAWPWGLSRVIDGLELVKADLKCDLTKIAVSGCSAAGKMALFCGALDERVTLTLAQESGGGGIPSWRVEKKLGAGGYACEKIDNTNYTWFIDALKTQNPDMLPHDHHELIAMIAPRAVLALGNHDYNAWLCDQGGVVSCQAAREVWKAMGVEDRMGWDLTGAHEHCSPAASQTTSANAFIDKFMKGNASAKTSIMIFPPAQKEAVANWVDWTTPTLDITPVINKNRISANVSNVRCFVNQSSSKFTIELSGDFSYSLMNQMGQILENGNGVNKTTVSKKYPMGIYFFKVNQGKTTSVVKLVKFGT